MAFNLFRSAQSGEGEAKKPDQKKQMIVLLIIIALFGYLYFFTGLMRPGEETAAEPARREPVNAMVKKPIPKRAETAPGEAAKPKQEQKPKPEEKGVPAKTQVAKAPEPPPAKPEPPKPAPKAAPAAQSKAAPQEKAPVSPKPVAPPASPAKPKTAVAAAPAAKPDPSAAGRYTLLAGEFPEGRILNDIKAAIRKAGIAPLHVKPGKTTKKMHRLVVGEYPEHDQALAEVQRMKKKGVDAFLGEKGDKYVAYGGSYFFADRAEVERKRLAGMGFNASIVKGEVTMRLSKVTAGSFASQDKARMAADKLKGKGVTVDVVEFGK